MISWAFVGTMYLIYLTYQDYTNKMKVDGRLNYFMMGFTFSLTAYFFNKTWYLLLLIAIGVLFTIFMTKSGYYGSADAKSVFWILFGFGIISYQNIIYFFICLGTITIVHFMLKKMYCYFLKLDQKLILKVQGYPVILLSFVICSFMFGLY